MIDFGSLWGCVGSIFGRFGASWGSFGGLGGSWAALGRLLGGLEAVLDRSWAALSRHGSLRDSLDPTRPRAGVELEGPSGAKMRPKWDPRRTKIEDKNEVEKTMS